MILLWRHTAYTSMPHLVICAVSDCNDLYLHMHTDILLWVLPHGAQQH